MQVAQEYMGEVDERITRMSTTLPGAVTLRGGTCGRLLGAIASVGLRYGSVERANRSLSNELGLRIYDFFRDITRKRSFGTVDCYDISGYDFTRPEGARHFIGTAAQKLCAELLVETTRFLLPMLNQERSDF